MFFEPTSPWESESDLSVPESAHSQNLRLQAGLLGLGSKIGVRVGFGLYLDCDFTMADCAAATLMCTACCLQAMCNLRVEMA